MVITVMFVLMFVLFLLTVPVAVAIGLSSSAALIMIDMPIGFVVQQYFTGLNSFTLLAIPFFILAGALMESTGILPYILLLIVDLLIITYIPPISLFLPGLMG